MDIDTAKMALFSFIDQGVELVVLDELTIEKPYGWVLFVESKEFVETGNPEACVAGNGPTVVLRDGSVHMLGSGQPTEDALREFERERGLDRPAGTDS